MPRAVQYETVDRDLLPFVVMVVLGITLIVIGQAGHLFGWWNDLGDWSTAIGLVLSVVGIAAGFLLNATRAQVAGVGQGVEKVDLSVEDVGRGVREVGAEVQGVRREHGEKLDDIAGTLHETRALLVQIRDRL
jgi:hypothetical protein